MTVLVSGGAGFIGSALVRALVADGEKVVTIDKLTYAGNLDNLAPVSASPNHIFIRADICDRAAVAAALHDYRPHAVYHLAAESHEYPRYRDIARCGTGLLAKTRYGGARELSFSAGFDRRGLW
jgi:dTDP-D-glucose 4,6-dehydratase